MNYQDLNEFLGAPIVERELKRNGKTITLHFVELTQEESEELFLGKKDISKGQMAKFAAMSVRKPDGTHLWNEKEAAKLPNTFLRNVIEVAKEVNGLAAKDGEVKNG